MVNMAYARLCADSVRAAVWTAAISDTADLQPLAARTHMAALLLAT